MCLLFVSNYGVAAFLSGYRVFAHFFTWGGPRMLSLTLETVYVGWAWLVWRLGLAGRSGLGWAVCSAGAWLGGLLVGGWPGALVLLGSNIRSSTLPTTS